MSTPDRMMTPEHWQRVKELVGQALEIDPAQRPAFLAQACAPNPSLLADVERLLAAEQRAGSVFLNEPAPLQLVQPDSEQASDRRIGQVFGPYKIVSVIGEGGMGTVYRATRADDQYQKEVAIKLVHAGKDSAFVVFRFKNERQILAALDHPNIARLLDGGTTFDGVPYFAMELIEGQPIDAYCVLHHLSIDARVKLFLDVCSAVQYAHRRLIVHRDLKPGNILVTAEGVPKLLDFGIAKILDAGVSQPIDQTTISLQILTPAYASPEQVRGEPITTSSDVYSLGVVLYELLTGIQPYRVASRTAESMARAIREQEPIRPSTAVRRMSSAAQGADADGKCETHSSAGLPDSPEKLSKRLAGDLDNIVLMALRKEPDRRYASVEQLAEDLRRYMDNLPVHAAKDTLSYRTRKFIARHMAAVVAGFSIATILVGALLVTLREARIARQERVRAEQRFNDVRKLANSLMFDIHDSIQGLPGSTAARKMLVDRALTYLDSLARDPGSDASLQRELAAGYDKVGDVQGSPYSSNLGDTKGALESYRKALAIRQQLAKSNPANALDALSVARSQRNVAGVAANRADPDAVEQSKQALAFAESVLKKAPGNPPAFAEVQIDHDMLAGILDGAGDFQQALEHTQAELPMIEARSNAAPASRGLKSGIAIVECRIGYELTRLGRRQEAQQHFLRGLQISESLASTPNDVERKRIYALGLRWFAEHLLMQGDVSGGLRAYRQAAVIVEPLAAADPKDLELNYDLASDLAGAGNASSILGQHKQGLELLERAATMLESDLVKDPAYIEPRDALGSAWVWTGDALDRQGDTVQALASYQKGLTVIEKLASDTRSERCQSGVAEIHVRIAHALAMLGKTDQANQEFQHALAIAEPITTSNPRVVEAHYPVADAYSGLGDLSQRIAANTHASGQQQVEGWKEAKKFYERSLAAWKSIENPGAITPSGFSCGSRSKVASAIARCDEALSRLRVAPTAQAGK